LLKLFSCLSLLFVLVSCAKKADILTKPVVLKDYAEQIGITIEPLIMDLHKPVAITHAGDGSGRLFITQQEGQIVVYDATRLVPIPFLDIAPLVKCCGERGLLSTAFHPNYARNGRFFINYTNTSGDTVIAEYKVSDNSNEADPDSARILLTIKQPTHFHNGGQLHFGPDGYLYIGMGDGGSFDSKASGRDKTGRDLFKKSQNLGTLLGKILRIDVDGTKPYAVPSSNPFVGNSDARDEIWAFGLRNPWRFSFDRVSGDLFIADVGLSGAEEVNIQLSSSKGGENYGWPIMEGSACEDRNKNCSEKSLIKPSFEFDHSKGCAIIGGYRYRGSEVAGLNGTYLYGDFCTGRVWGAAKNEDHTWRSFEIMDTPLMISSFGEDESGEIYIAHYGSVLIRGSGIIYRIVSSRE
jgi:glucose/arabinose dehydrogenase